MEDTFLLGLRWRTLDVPRWYEHDFVYCSGFSITFTPKDMGWVVCSISHTLPGTGCHTSSQGGAPGGSAEILGRCWRRQTENVPRLPYSLRGEGLNGKVVTKGSLKGIPMVLSPETWTFRRISLRHRSPSDSQRWSDPKVSSAFWGMSSCIY